MMTNLLSFINYYLRSYKNRKINDFDIIYNYLKSDEGKPYLDNINKGEKISLRDFQNDLIKYLEI